MQVPNFEKKEEGKEKKYFICFLSEYFIAINMYIVLLM